VFELILPFYALIAALSALAIFCLVNFLRGEFIETVFYALIIGLTWPLSIPVIVVMLNRTGREQHR
jgi:hypothetical protein